MKRFKILVIIGLLSGFSSGCAVTDSAKAAFSQTARMFRPNPNDDPYEPDVEDKWAFVGEEARGDRPMERDPDRWWRNLMMSERALTIERSLGIE